MGLAQAHRVPRNQRSSFAMISIVLLSGGAKTAENPIMESACNYEASVSYVLPRASQHARDSNGVRERTRAPALIYFTWRKREGERMLRTRFFILVFLLQPSLPLRRRRCFVMPLYIQLSSTRRRPRSCIISSKFRRRSTHKCSFSFFFLFYFSRYSFMNAKNFKFSLKSILSLFFICRVGMHENILHHFLFKNFIFLGPLVRDLVRDIVLSWFFFSYD